MILDTQGDERVIEDGREIHLEHGRPLARIGHRHQCDRHGGGGWRARCRSTGLSISARTSRNGPARPSPVRHPFDHEVLGVVDISGPGREVHPAEPGARGVDQPSHRVDNLARATMQDRERLARALDPEIVALEQRRAHRRRSSRRDPARQRYGDAGAAAWRGPTSSSTARYPLAAQHARHAMAAPAGRAAAAGQRRAHQRRLRRIWARSSCCAATRRARRGAGAPCRSPRARVGIVSPLAGLEPGVQTGAAGGGAPRAVGG